MKFPKLGFDLLSILIVNFSAALGFSLVIPLLVFLTTQYGGNAFIYGVVGSLYAFCSFLSAPVLGRWSDIFGRKPIIVLCQVGTLLGWLILLAALFLPIIPLTRVQLPLLGSFTITLPLVVLCIARIVDGITAGDISAAQAYIADISNDSERGNYYGLLSVSANIGFVVGPGLAGVLAATILKEKLPILLAIVVAILAIFFTGKFLRESNQQKNNKQEKRSIGEAIKNPDTRVMLAIYFILYIGFTLFYTAFPIFATSALHWTIGKMGLYFSFLALLMSIVQGPVLVFASKRFPDSILAIAGTAILGINFLLLTTGNDWVILIAFACFAIGNGIMWPSILSLLSKTAGSYQGTVQGFASSAGSLSSVIGLLLGGILYTYFHGATFFFSAACIFITLIFAPKLLSLKKSTQ